MVLVCHPDHVTSRNQGLSSLALGGGERETVGTRLRVPVTIKTRGREMGPKNSLYLVLVLSPSIQHFPTYLPQNIAKILVRSQLKIMKQLLLSGVCNTYVLCYYFKDIIVSFLYSNQCKKRSSLNQTRKCTQSMSD